MIARRLRDKKARGEPITFENFVIDTIIPIINPGSISKLCGSQKDYKTQKVARPKKAEKKDKKGKEEARKKFGTGNRKKTSKFWLKRMHQIYILYMFGLVFGKSIFLVKKIAFWQN